MKSLGLLFLAVSVSWVVAVDDPVSTEMATGARQWLQSLDDDERDAATFAFDDDERRNWHFIPRDRAGFSLKGAGPASRLLAERLLATGLSTQGMQRALDIMALERVLFEKEGRAIRDPELYFVTVFGAPSTSSDWGFRVEGHHLSVNFSLRDGKLQSSAPLFMGANPADVRDGSLRGMRALAEEEEQGRSLFERLAPAAQHKARIADAAPDDIVTGATRRADIGAAAGLPYSEMSSEERRDLLGLVELYARRLRPEIAGCGAGSHRASRPRHDPFRMGGKRRARRAALLPDPRPELPHRVRQYSERCESHSHRMARSHRRLRPVRL